MPTRTDFETAAELFMTAAGLISDLAVSAQGADTTQVVRGGSLGHQVADRVASAASSASRCRQQVLDAAETCRVRAEMIADYELELVVYDRSYDRYRGAAWTYATNYAAWLEDETGTIRHPGYAPAPPRRPSPPPAWAEVRRP